MVGRASAENKGQELAKKELEPVSGHIITSISLRNISVLTVAKPCSSIGIVF